MHCVSVNHPSQVCVVTQSDPRFSPTCMDRSSYTYLILVKWVMERNRDMSGELMCSDSQAVLSPAAGVRRQKPSGWYIPVKAPHESFITVFEHWSVWVLAWRLDSALEGRRKSEFSHVNVMRGNVRTSMKGKKKSQQKDKEPQLTFCSYNTCA